jgi:hypothetical protein
MTGSAADIGTTRRVGGLNSGLLLDEAMFSSDNHGVIGARRRRATRARSRVPLATVAGQAWREPVLAATAANTVGCRPS